MNINRITVKFKYFIEDSILVGHNNINRITVKFKSICFIVTHILFTILIESQWNLNVKADKNALDGMEY